MKNILSKESGDITIEFDEKNICFHLANFVLICRLIEGRYPNYMSVIPQNNSNRLIIDRTLFISVLRRISVFSDPANSLVRLDLSPNRLVVSAQYAGLSTSPTKASRAIIQAIRCASVSVRRSSWRYSIILIRKRFWSTWPIPVEPESFFPGRMSPMKIC